MKKVLGLSLAFVLNIAVLSYLSGQYGWGNGMRGEGASTTRDLSIDNFTGFKLSLPANVYLRQGSTQSVRVEGQANIIDNITTEVSGGVWRIGFKQNVRESIDLKIFITIPTLTEAWVSGSGSVIGETMFSGLDQLSLGVSGSGDLRLEFEANQVESKVSGSGDLNLNGRVRQQQMVISGSGDIEAYGLVSESAQATISGSGTCKLNATQALQATVSGSGDIFYKGNPGQVQSKVSGSGDISSRM